jgi:hypothetical protein
MLFPLLSALALVVFQYKRFFIFEIPCAFHGQIEIDQMPVKLWSVDAGELGIFADFDAAGAAHAGSVHHNRIHADQGLDPYWFCEVGYGFHHNHRPDSPYDTDFFASVQNRLDSMGSKSLHPIGTVVRGNNDFITDGSHFIFEDDQVLVFRGNMEITLLPASFKAGQSDE